MIAVVHMTKITENGITASARIAKFLFERLELSGFKVSLIDTLGRCKDNLGTKFDTTFIVNGPMAFCDFLPELGSLVLNTDRLIWVQNDIICKPPSTFPNKAESPFRKAFSKYNRPLPYWTTLPSMVTTVDSRYINWNLLTYTPPISGCLMEEGIVYYGAYRPDREIYFKKYFNTDLYPVFISSTVHSKFSKLCPNIVPRKKFDHPLCNELSKYEATVYIEDKLSHSIYCSPANRFYESLSAGVAQAVDCNAAVTLKKAGLIVKDEWIVEDDKDICTFLENSQEYSSEQADLWCKDYRKELEDSVDSIIKELLL